MKLSIVIPVYNSAPMLEELFSGIRQALQGKQDFEVIFVDDGSRDNSWEKLEALKKNFPDAVTAIRLSRNFGQHNAIVCGFGFVKGEIVLTMDDDLQHPPAEIPKLLEKFKETNADVVYGIPKNRQHGALRIAGSYFLRKTSRYAAGNTGEGSSFRLLKRHIVEKIAQQQQRTMLFIDEILHWYTGNIVTIDVEHHARRQGRSGYTMFRLIGLVLDIVVNHSALPLKLMTWIGLLSSLLTFALGVRFIYRKLMYDVQPGFTAQIVAILFSASVLMLCMGIVGQYMYKLFLLQSRRPPFLIDKQI